MVKLIDILEAYGANFRENFILPKLDTRLNRKLMNILSKKFSFDYFRQNANKWALEGKRHIFFNPYNKHKTKGRDELSYYNIHEYMKESLFLDEGKIEELSFLLVTNLKVENWLTDPILEPYDYYYYDIEYYDDYVTDLEDENCETCDECGGSGYEDEDCGYCNGEGEVRYECGYCDGEGSIRDDEGEEEECDECSGSGNDFVECDECHGNGRSNEDCGWCGGDTEICHTEYFKTLEEMRMKIISPVELPHPGKPVGAYYSEDYSDWFEKVKDIEGVIVLQDIVWDRVTEEYDPDKTDGYKLDIYKKENKIKYFEDTTLKEEMENWRFDQIHHPFKTILRR